jgi:hypothetical protein
VAALAARQPSTVDSSLRDSVRDFYADAEFTCSELVADAQLEHEAGRSELRRALAAVGVRVADPQAAVRLGVVFRDLDGIERIGRNRRGATVWRVTDIPSATLCTRDE